jgi:hypothetical protein
MAEDKESVYDKIRREMREKQEAERVRRERWEQLKKEQSPEWAQRLRRNQR